MLKKNITELINEYINQLENPITKKNFKTILNKYVDNLDYLEQIETIKNSDLAQNTKGIYTRILKSFYVYLHDKHGLDVKTSKFKHIKEVPTKRRAFTDYEIEEIKNVINRRRDEYSFWFNFLIHNGCRVREMLNLNASDFNYYEETQTYKAFISALKGGNLRVFEIPQQYNHNFQDFFNKKITYYALGIRFKTLMRTLSKKLNKPEFEHQTLHCFRTTFITNAVRDGFSIFEISKLTGHKSSLSVNRYVQLTASDVWDKYKNHVTQNRAEIEKAILDIVSDMQKRANL
ncbi:tyrosine-type recombinase/integrase [Mycoplasmopsis pullorum]|uniref:Tyr recombinase domain-containing protein n=1 Tax=Mycoplasmopsis pullorum TaxID=48003 RepID=A0A1L4FSA6_9BACT|nr:site-specific integrase [Mycoplasmopsis pullorum]APJ38497.1 hypothetical protein BLA55_02405 [Mycoplasmopsis pullorum]